jgi:hypothetical protein
MKLVLFRPAGAAADVPLTVGALAADGVHVADVTAALAAAGAGTINSMRVFLELGEKGAAAAKTALGDATFHRKLADVELRAPIYDPCVPRGRRARRSHSPARCCCSRCAPRPEFTCPPHPAPARPAVRRCCAWA